MKTLAIFCLLGVCATCVFAGPRTYQSGKILGFDTGQRVHAKHSPKDEVVYQVQVEGVVYKVTNHSRKRDFSAGEEVQCRVEKNRLIIEKLKGGEVKYDIVGESVQQERAPGENP